MNMLHILKRQRHPEPPNVDLATLLQPYGVADAEADAEHEVEENR